MPPWIATLLAIAGGVATIGGAVVAIRQATPVVRTVIGVFNDFAGEPARPGVAARPGVIESLSNIKATQTAQGAQLASVTDELGKVRHELHPNSGLSLRDAVDRMEKAVTAQGDRTDRLESALNGHISDQRAAVVNAEASVIVAEAAATGAREAVVGAKEAVVGAREAVVGAREAVDAALARETARVNVNVVSQ